MIEAYAFFAMFTAQILAMSVLQPARFSRYIRIQGASIPAERLAQVYPGIDVGLARERFLQQFRMLSTAVAVLGLLLLGWFFSYMRRPDWHASTVLIPIGIYFGVQFLPTVFVNWLGVRFNKVHQRPLHEPKRTAVLQRRGLFDFISPILVFLAVLSYVLFAAFVIYVQTHPSDFGDSFKPWRGPALLGCITLLYVLEAVIVYVMLYGLKASSFVTHAGRLHMIGVAVKACMYACIACVVYFALTYTLVLLNLDRWQPFALSACLVASTLISLMGTIAPPREPDANELGVPPEWRQTGG